LRRALADDADLFSFHPDAKSTILGAAACRELSAFFRWQETCDVVTRPVGPGRNAPDGGSDPAALECGQELAPFCIVIPGG